MLVTTPAIDLIRRAFPDAEIDFLTEPASIPVLKNNPHVTSVVEYDKKRAWSVIRHVRARRYDAVVDFFTNPRTALLTALSGARARVGFRKRGRSYAYNVIVPMPDEIHYPTLRKFHLVRAWLRHAGVPFPDGVPLLPHMYLDDMERRFAEDWMTAERLAPRGFFVINPATRMRIRAWRPERFREVGLELTRRWNMPTYVAWGPGEENLAAEVRAEEGSTLRLLPAADLRNMAAILAHARLVVSTDSGAKHLSIAVGTPTVSLYGSTSRIGWSPGWHGLTSLDYGVASGAAGCTGCESSRDHCDRGHECMEKLTPEEVLQACDGMIRRHTKR